MAKKKSKKKHKKPTPKPVAAAATKKTTKETKPQKVAKSESLAQQHQLPVDSKTSSKKTIILIIVLVIIVLAGVMLFLFGQAQMAKDNAANTGQDDLLKVQPAAGDSLQPTNTGNQTNPQQSAPSPQGSSGDSSQLQQSSQPDSTSQPTQ